MKPIIAVLLAALLALSFAACAKTTDRPAETAATPAATEEPVVTPAPEPTAFDPAAAIVGTWEFSRSETMANLSLAQMSVFAENMPEDYVWTMVMNADGTGYQATTMDGNDYLDSFTYQIVENVLNFQFDGTRAARVFELEGDRLTLYRGGSGMVLLRTAP